MLSCRLSCGDACHRLWHANRTCLQAVHELIPGRMFAGILFDPRRLKHQMSGLKRKETAAEKLAKDRQLCASASRAL